MTTQVPNSGEAMLFYPSNFKELPEFSMPAVAFAVGWTCEVADYEISLRQWASHGFLIIASTEHDDRLRFNPGAQLTNEWAVNGINPIAQPMGGRVMASTRVRNQWVGG
eukprot:1179752-Prorocentrum_minimum.AAC.1